MPNTARIINDGVLRKMASSVPDISCVAWSTIMTGKNPGDHGIYGFMNLAPGTYEFTFPNFTDLKCSPFWDVMKDKKCAIINMPATYPARRMNGVMISGFVAIELAKAVYPPELLPELREMDYRIDVDAAKGHREMDAFIADLGRTLESRIKAYRHLWEREEWDIFCLVFTGTDRLGHFLFEAFENEDHPYHGKFRDHFRRIDEIIGELHDKTAEDDLFIMLSDHGFGKIDKEVNVNHFLHRQGFLKLNAPSPDSFNGVAEGSLAFALDPARIYVNLEGRYPRGRVKADDRKKVVDDVATAFRELEADGKRVVKRICTRDEIYSGPFTDMAPDIVIMPHAGFDLKARLTAGQLTSKGVFTGMHTYDNAFLLTRSASLRQADIPQSPWVGDFRRLLECGLRA
jgi:predicted AlkP superfamily phosphohydrolase/phosphomutase